MLPVLLFLASALPIPTATVQHAFGGHPGALVVIDCTSGKTFRSDAKACAEKLPPCSTFKIWNSAIGLETGLVTDPDALFWKWDGAKRDIATWNHDQTMRSAFAASCVPAYQNLARKIGAKRMQSWLDKIQYGDRNITAGIDVFWLPHPGRKTLLISADEQAEMIARLVQGKLPFSPHTLSALKSIMLVKTTAKGKFYGKTGSSGDGLGWFVGYVESSGQTYAFACFLQGKGLLGQDARDAAEKIFVAQGLL